MRSVRSETETLREIIDRRESEELWVLAEVVRIAGEMKRQLPQKLTGNPAPNFPQWGSPNLRIPNGAEFAVLRQKVQEAKEWGHDVGSRVFKARVPSSRQSEGVGAAGMLQRIEEEGRKQEEVLTALQEKLMAEGEAMADGIIGVAEKLIDTVKRREWPWKKE